MRNQSVPRNLQEEAATWVWVPLVSGAERINVWFLKVTNSLREQPCLTGLAL